jgi:FixJ family two-component response regulator
MRESRQCNAVIALVDDDPSFRRGLERPIGSVETFASAREFLFRPRTQGPGCLVLELHLPGLSGFIRGSRSSTAAGVWA